MKRPRVNYNEITVVCNNAPCKQAPKNYYSILIDFFIDKYGSEPVRIALEEIINEE